VTFAVVVLGAVLAVFPATAAIGLLLCLLAIVPAFVAHRRTRKGTATNRGRSVAALAMAPAFLVVGIAVVAATAPAPQVTTASDTSVLAAAPAPPAAVAPLIAAPAPASTTIEAGLAAEPAPAEGAATLKSTVTSSRKAVAKPAPKPAPVVRVAAPAHTAARTATPAPSPVVQPLAAPPSSKPAPKPVAKPAPKPVAEPAPVTCDAAHYINSSGHCVPRPGTTPVEGKKASARCKDGNLSYSEHRSGTCSGHGGVAEWL
jgi:hypothetical protein